MKGHFSNIFGLGNETHKAHIFLFKIITKILLTSRSSHLKLQPEMTIKYIIYTYLLSLSQEYFDKSFSIFSALYCIKRAIMLSSFSLLGPRYGRQVLVLLNPEKKDIIRIKSPSWFTNACSAPRTV